MKKLLLFGCLSVFISCMIACDNQENKNSHTHEDGSTHSDHNTDTVKPAQEEFTVDSAQADTIKGKEHDHGDGEKHSH